MKALLRTTILIFSMLAASVAVAQSSGAVSKKKAPPRAKAPPKRPKNQLQLRLSGIIWQEALQVSNGAARGSMETQSQGMIAGMNYMISAGGSQRWFQSYGIDLGFGAIKGKGNTPALADELKGQMWVLAGFNPGVMYRTSPVSTVGLLLPLTYRRINWQLKDGSTFNPEGDSSFSLGVSALYLTQISKRSSLMLAVTHQTNWSATSWSAGYQYRAF